MERVVISTIVESVTTAPTVDHPGIEALAWAHRRFGRAYFGWLGRRYLYLMGPEANEFVFAHDEFFRFREAMAALIPVDGPTSVIVSDGEEHARRRGLVRPGLSPRQVNRYLGVMAASADEALDVVRPGEPFDAYALFRAAIRRSTLRALFGERMAARAGEVGVRLQPLMDLVDLLPQTIALHERFRTPRWRRAMASRERLDAFVYGEIARVRALDADAESQVLTTLVHGRDGAGSNLSDLEIRDQTVTMIAAGYETTSAAMGWTLYALGGRPDLVERARAEVVEVTAGEPPTVEDLDGLRLLDAIVTEALRLYPPAAITARYVAEGFEFGGRRARPGDLVIVSPYVTHRRPDLYDDPRAFRPERWLEGPRRPPHEYLPFGGGVHRCLGSTMATVELRVMLARLLSRGPFALEPQRVRATSVAAMRPRDGVRIRLPAAPQSRPRS